MTGLWWLMVTLCLEIERGTVECRVVIEAIRSTQLECRQLMDAAEADALHQAEDAGVLLVYAGARCEPGAGA